MIDTVCDTLCNIILVITLAGIIFAWGYDMGHRKGVKNTYASMKDYLDDLKKNKPFRLEDIYALSKPKVIPKPF